MAGFIYIFSNKAYGRLLKIGKSARDPADGRASELYNTSAPEPFRLEYFAFVEDFDAVELRVHSHLKSHRPNPDREFFDTTVPEAIAVIRKCARTIHFEKDPNQQRLIARALEKQRADEHASKEAAERKQRSIAERSQKLPQLISKYSLELDSWGRKLIHSALDPDEEEGKIQWGKLLGFLAFPPIALYYGRRDQNRYEYLANDEYDQILERAILKLNELENQPYSEDWKARTDAKFKEVRECFLREVKTHIAKYINALN